jgi:hypothetical protein
MRGYSGSVLPNVATDPFSCFSRDLMSAERRVPESSDPPPNQLYTNNHVVRTSNATTAAKHAMEFGSSYTLLLSHQRPFHPQAVVTVSKIGLCT